MDKNKILADLAMLIQQNSAAIIAQNQLDLAAADALDPTLVDRLKVDEKKVQNMIAAVKEVMNLEDPIGKILSEYDHPNGMKVTNKVVPFGRILIIYESRPDVTIEAAISAFKAGNKIYLKGGKEAVHTNLYLVDLWHKALKMNKIALDYVQYLNIDRTTTQTLIKDNPHHIDLIIPRGGEGLINYIRANTSIPLLVSGRGNNFAYIHEDADFEMAINIVLNGKSRLSVCNALDKVYLQKTTTDLQEKTARLVTALAAQNIEIYGTAAVCKLVENVKRITDENIFYEEFLAAKIVLDIVPDLPTAIQKINRYSGGHSASIICENETIAHTFQQEVDCAAVFHNASTRFTDGGQFGFGAEIAISTQKLHFRGPVGLAQLVTNKWFVNGHGQVRN